MELTQTDSSGINASSDELVSILSGDDETKSRKLLDNGVSPNIVDRFGRTPIHVAALKGRQEMCKLLHQYGADLNLAEENGESPLNIAAKERQHEVVHYLLDAGADPNIADKSGVTPLYHMCREGDADMVDLLIGHGADVNSKGCLEVAIEFYNTEIVNLLVQKYRCKVETLFNGLSPLMLAAKTNNIEAVKLLLDKKADPNKLDEMQEKDRLPALGFALQSGNDEIIEMLADKTDIENYRKHDGLRKLTDVVCQVDYAGENLLKRIVSNDRVRDRLIERASFYGAARVLKFALKSMLDEQKPTILYHDRLKILEDAIKSDNAAAFKEVQEYCKRRCEENPRIDNALIEEKNKFRKLALSRGKTDILVEYAKAEILETYTKFGMLGTFKTIKLLQDFSRDKILERYSLEEILETIDDKELLDTVFFEDPPKKPDILVKVPKSEEFPYYDVLSDKLIPMIENEGSGGFLKFDTLLDNLHTPPVHYKKPKPNCIIKVQVPLIQI